ncbi:MAG: hypothetical protein U0797_21980 [Gemmataceae bacterium]
MLALFLIRLALGLTACLLLLSPHRTARPTAQQPALANANFFRTQLLVVFALSVGALLWLRADAAWPVLTCLLAAATCAGLGSASWSLERSPGALTLLVLTTAALVSALAFTETNARALAGGLSSALLLGAATSAMLLGHNYLVAPNMTMTPLYRLLGALAAALALRLLVDGWALWQWTANEDLANLEGDQVLWLPVRWAVGFAAPAVLCWMAWQTARIRSTQSATGILYVVVIFCFLGELTGQLLRPAGLTL